MSNRDKNQDGGRFAAFLPIDRRQTLASGVPIPERSYGTVLFADISGFTPLTESLARDLGVARGAEELVRQLDAVYTALIDQIHLHGGSVVSFSGDAITCWFPGEEAVPAASCGLALQRIMGNFADITLLSGARASLAIKVGLARGPVRRFLVGDANYQLIDIMAGRTLDIMAVAGELAGSGEIVIAPEVVAALEPRAVISSQRYGPGGQPFSLLADLIAPAGPTAQSPEQEASLPDDQARPFIQPSVYERMLAGQAGFIAEIRYVAALFLSFSGLDFDEDAAVASKLDAYIRWVQQTLARYEGTLLQLTTGDKGSYLYATFGAPTAHEDDVERATAAAVALRQLPPELDFVSDIRIGLSWGRMFAGNYGSPSRRTYGVMGPETNMAARLMQKATPGQILGSDRFCAASRIQQFAEVGLFQLKGREEPMLVCEVVDRRPKQASQTPDKTPMVGRSAEWALLEERLQALQSGQSPGVVIIEGEAGIGKSRLLSELLERARAMNIFTFIGAGDAIERSAAYHAWWPVFRTILIPEETQDTSGIQARAERRLNELDPALVEQLPLLNSVLPVSVPDNDLTRSMEGRVRADNTRDLLVRLLNTSTTGRPLLLVLEDGHWFDSASWALLHQVNREVRPLFLVVTSRPAEMTTSGTIPIGEAETGGDLAADIGQLLASDGAALVRLDRLSKEETISLIARRLGIKAVPQTLGDFIHRRAEGHPFFAEELAYALRDSGHVTVEAGQAVLAPALDDLTTLDFPDTLQGIIVSRVDRLQSQQQLTLKVGSVIGRVFPYRTLHDVYPVSDERARLMAYLEQLETLDIAYQETPEPDLAYIFKHAITQEVVYQMLTFAQRQRLHQDVATWYEALKVDELSRYYTALAYHWSQAEVVDKTIEYLDKAGEQALENYANEEAIRFISRSLNLVKNEPGAGLVPPVRLARWQYILGEAFYRLGRLEESSQHFRLALKLLKRPVPGGPAGQGISLLGQLLKQFQMRSRFLPGPGKTRLSPEQRGEVLLAYNAYARFSEVSYLTGSTNLTVYGLLNSLNMAERLGPSPELARAYANMSAAAGLIPVHGLARMYQRLALEAVEQVDDPDTLGEVYWSISVYTAGVGAWVETEANLQKALAVFAQYGNWPRWGICQEMMTRLAYSQGDFRRMEALAEELLETARRRNDLLQQGWSAMGLVESLLLLEDRCDDAIRLVQEMMDDVMTSSEPGGMMKAYCLLATAYLRQGRWPEAEKAAGEALAVIRQVQPTSFGMLMQFSLTAFAILGLWESLVQEEGRGSPREGVLVQQAQEAGKSMAGFARVFPIGVPRRDLIDGLIAWLKGKEGRAQELWDRARDRAGELGMLYDQGLACYEIGRHLPAGDPRRRENLAQAIDIFRRLQVPHERSLAEQALALNNQSHDT